MSYVPDPAFQFQAVPLTIKDRPEEFVLRKIRIGLGQSISQSSYGLAVKHIL